MNNNNGNESAPQHQPNQDPRLPQIDPVTFAALNTIDTFLGKAPLTRQEHADANKSLQHIVQTVEMLQAAVKQLSSRLNGQAGPAALHTGAPSSGSAVVAEAAEEIFRNAR